MKKLSLNRFLLGKQNKHGISVRTMEQVLEFDTVSPNQCGNSVQLQKTLFNPLFEHSLFETLATFIETKTVVGK
jgi:hypothetical protein